MTEAQLSALEPAAADAARGALRAFVAWLDRFGETSQDPYDFSNTRIGGRAKAR